MPNYRWVCDNCRLTTDVVRPMAESQKPPTCSYCEVGEMRREYGAAMQYTYGRDTFHDGVDGTGETARETADRWVKEGREAGLDPQPAQRWV